jgi:hypothetical protein
MLRIILTMLSLWLPQSEVPSTVDRTPIIEALSWVKTAVRNQAEFDYVMTVRVRLLFFWAGKDDVGGGYIRRSVSQDDPREELLQVLFGSDPAKAPRAINRWGAGTEVVRHREPVPGATNSDDVVSSAFFGFMKSSKGKSVSEMQEELKKEKAVGEHQFSGILSRVDGGRAISLVVPLSSAQDFSSKQYDEAEPLMLEKLRTSDRPPRTLNVSADCPRASEFLGTVWQLTGAAMENIQTPKSLCYVYDAQVITLTLERVLPVRKLNVKVNAMKGSTLVEQSYEDLVQGDFVSANPNTGRRVNFSIILGTKGKLRAVPVQIRYQPNWWFQIVLNLLPGSGIEK